MNIPKSRPILSLLNVEPDGYSEEALGVLQDIANIDNGPLTRNELLEKVKNYEVLIVRLNHKIDGELLERADKLETIVSATTGLNHIDTSFAESKGVSILSLRGETSFLKSVNATAEHSWALLLAVLRNIPSAQKHVFSGGWDRDVFKGHELEGKTLGIIGFGRLGKKVAQYGAAFGMTVLAFEKRKLSAAPSYVMFKEMDELLAVSDIISLHVDYTPENHGLLGSYEFSLMKNGVILINTARGEIIDEAALIDAFRDGTLGGLGLDVLCGENVNPLNRNNFIAKFKEAPNVIITPHIGGCTFESMERTEIFMAEKLKQHYMEKWKI